MKDSIFVARHLKPVRSALLLSSRPYQHIKELTTESFVPGCLNGNTMTNFETIGKYSEVILDRKYSIGKKLREDESQRIMSAKESYFFHCVVSYWQDLCLEVNATHPSQFLHITHLAVATLTS